jgi:hypothetical protein
VSNIGRGPASDVQVEFTVLGLNTVKRTWKQQLLTPGQFQDFFIPVSEDEEQHYITYFETNATKIKLSSIYKDVIGKNHSNQEVIDVSEFVRQFKKTKSVYAEDRIDLISRNMTSIADELRTISRNILSIGNSLADKDAQNTIAYKFDIIYHTLSQMNISFDTNSDLGLLLYSLQNELVTYRRSNVLQAVLQKIKDINIEAYSQIIIQFDEFKR